MTKADAVWLTILAGGLGYEAWTLYSRDVESTLSETTRRTFRVRTKPGRVLFAVSWSGFALWFLFHIVKESNSE